MKSKVVVFLGVMLLSLCAFAQIETELFPYETFDSWAVPGSPPTGWIRIVGGSEGTPTENTNDWHPAASGSGTWSTNPVARIYWAPTEVADDYLITPPFDGTTTGLDSIVLTYETDYDLVSPAFPGVGDNCVLLSTDDGVTWPDTLWLYGASDPADIHETRRIDITALVDGHTNCKIAFWECRDLGFENWWELDNICVFAYNLAAEPEAPAFVYTCEELVPPGTSTYSFEVSIGDISGVDPTSAELCYSLNGAAWMCVGLTYDSGLPDGTGDYHYNMSGLDNWDIVEYLYRATDTWTVATTGSSDVCSIVVGGDYYVYENGSGYAMSPDPTWQDISTIGWDTGIYYDEAVAPLALPFTFRWYGVDYDTLFLSTNGWFSFEPYPGDAYWVYHPLPYTSEPKPIIAAWWEDFTTEYTGFIYYYISVDGDTVIVQFQDVPRLFGASETFQTVFINPAIESHPGGNGSAIVRYLTKNEDGGSLGISNEDGSLGIQYWYDGAMGSPDYIGFEAGRAIRYCSTPPPEGGDLYGFVTLTGRTDHSGAIVGIVGTSLTGTADAAGYYEVNHITEGTYDAYCTHPAFYGDTAYGVIVVDGSMTHRDFTLFPRPTGYIAGYADLTDTPVSDIGIDCEALGTGVTDLTDATGLFIFDGVGVGDNQVVATFPGYEVGYSPLVVVVSGETTWVDTVFLDPLPVDSLEDDDGGGVADPMAGAWEWGTPTYGPSGAYSGVNCWGTDLDDDYVISANWKLDIPVPYPCSEFGWHQWINMESGFSLAWDGGNVKVSTDGGTIWTLATPLDTAYNLTAATSNVGIPGELCWSNDDDWDVWLKQRIALTPDVTHIRFHFGSDGSFVEPGWFVDDFIWQRIPTGDLEVFVYDCETYEVIEGALVYATGASGYTGPDGRILLDGVQYGEITVSAGKPGYWANRKDAVVFIDETMTLLMPICPIDIGEITGQLTHTADDSIMFELCNPTEDTIWFHFTGIPGAPGSSRSRIERPNTVKTGFGTYNENAKFDMTAAPLPEIDHSTYRARPEEVGAVIDSYSIPETNLPWGFGIEGRAEIRKVWISDRHEIGGIITQVQNMAWNYPAWGYSGIFYDIGRFHWPDYAPAITWWCDMAWDANRNLMWQIESEETFKIYGWDPMTGEVVDSLGGTWASALYPQRGLGYDFARDLFYIGNWTTALIYEVKGPSWDVPGQVITTFSAPSCAGIAFDEGRRTIWYAQSGATGLINEIDPSTGEIINTIAAPHSEIGGLAGLDMDSEGRLWIMNYAVPRIYVIEAPSSVLPGGMYVNPAIGYIAPGECEMFALVNPAYANPVGDYDFDLYFYPDPNLEPTLMPVHVQVLPKSPKGWSLISVPVMAAPNDPFIQFMDDITPFDVDHTVSNIYGWNQDDGIYELPTGFERGRGYYLKTWLEGTFWDVYGAPYAPGDFTYPVYYPEDSPSYGWWVIGNPYNVRVDWDAVYAATDFSYLYPEYWTWTQKEGYKSYSPITGGHGEGNLIDSWIGYMVNVRSGNPAVYTNIVYPQDGTMETVVAKFRPKAKKVETINPAEFALRVSVNARNGSDIRNDLYNYISVNELAIDGIDIYDSGEPSMPIPGDAIKAYFDNSGMRLMCDTKANFSGVSKEWTFAIRDLPAGMTVTLKWPQDRIPTGDDVSCGVDNLDERWNLTMTDPIAGTTIDMREVYSYTFTSGSGIRRMTMTLGDVPLDVDERKLPDEFALSANKPNPFNATTEFTLSLPVNTDVKVEVYDLLGQKVSTLIDGQMEAGYQRVIWNGRDVGGREVPSGLYLYKVIAGDFRETRKMTLIK